jgi:hypothetical protein
LQFEKSRRANWRDFSIKIQGNARRLRLTDAYDKLSNTRLKPIGNSGYNIATELKYTENI